jgi:uncharacterized protein YllA (UPF0747 family)
MELSLLEKLTVAQVVKKTFSAFYETEHSLPIQDPIKTQVNHAIFL